MGVGGWGGDRGGGGGLGQTPTPAVTLIRDKRLLRRLTVLLAGLRCATLLFTSCSLNVCLDACI